jgi:hypothetical protein
MAGIPGMGGAAPGAGGGAGPQSPTMKVSGDFTVDFDIKVGMLTQIEGTMQTGMEMAGVSMKATSTMAMKKIP